MKANPFNGNTLEEPIIVERKKGSGRGFKGLGKTDKTRHYNGANSKLEKALHNDGDARQTILHETPKHRMILQYSLQGHATKAIAELVGMTPTYVSQVLRQPWARKYMIEEAQESANTKLKQLIEAEAEGAFQRVVEIAKNAMVLPNVRLAANQEVLNRFLGKPNQPVSVEEKNLDNLTDAELMAMLPKKN